MQAVAELIRLPSDDRHAMCEMFPTETRRETDVLQTQTVGGRQSAAVRLYQPQQGFLRSRRRREKLRTCVRKLDASPCLRLFDNHMDVGAAESK
jgi:hypothetical protein